MRELKDVALRGRRVLLRLDLNVPRRDCVIISTARIKSALPTINFARAAGAKVLLMSHVGRPAENCDRDRSDPKYSLAAVADCLSDALGAEVKLYRDYLTTRPQINNGEVALLENVRFNAGEQANADSLAKKYAALCDVFVMDAFAAAHRRQASTHGVIKFARVSCAGLQLAEELVALEKIRTKPPRPLVAIVGGAKVSTKLAALKYLSRWADVVIPGGGMANTFLAANNSVGKSLVETDLVDAAQKMMRESRAKIILPEDVVVATAVDSAAVTKPVHSVGSDEMILDIGAKTIAEYEKIIAAAASVVWNGPVGLFERPQFAAGTAAIARAIAAADAYSVAGGGETLAAIEQFVTGDKLSYASTGGGAFLEFLEGKTLPAVAALINSAA